MTDGDDWQEIGDQDVYELGSDDSPRHALVRFGEGGTWVWTIRWEFVDCGGATNTRDEAMEEAMCVWNALELFYGPVEEPGWDVDLAFAYWMTGVAVAHLLRFFVFDDPLNRMVVAGAGVFIYSLAALLWARDRRGWASVITVLFPLVGLFAVLITGAEVDDWQLAVGVTQFAALHYVAIEFIKKFWRKFRELRRQRRRE